MSYNLDIDANTETPTEYLHRLVAELGEALADVALLERLKGAETKAALLTSQHKAEADRQSAINDASAIAVEAARFSACRDITISDSTPTAHVLGSSFIITFTALAWDMYANASLPVPRTVTGFDALPPIALEYLIEKHPGRIPTKIRGLAADPHEAFSRYFTGLRRGHLTASAYDTFAGKVQ